MEATVRDRTGLYKAADKQVKASKELAQAKRRLAHKSQELLRERQLNHQPLGRIRELETGVERGGAPVARDSHNSHLPPSSDLPWQKVPRTRSLRRKSGRRPGGQLQHRGATLKQSARPNHLITHAPEACPGCGASLHEAEVLLPQSSTVIVQSATSLLRDWSQSIVLKIISWKLRDGLSAI